MRAASATYFGEADHKIRSKDGLNNMHLRMFLVDQLRVHYADSEKYGGGSGKFLVLHVFALSLSNKTSDHTV